MSSSTYTLHPGDVVRAGRGDTLETLLGSCVAVILTDRMRTVGAMCHIVHHRAPRSEGRASRTRFADGAIDHMYELLLSSGMSPQLCEAFVYGGGNMFPDADRQLDVGRSNADSVLQRLQRDGVQIALTDLGGASYRRLRWTIGGELPHVTATSARGNAR